MRICRFDNDRLGLVTNGFVHDATHIQEQIRAAAPYAMKGHMRSSRLYRSGGTG